MKCENYCTKSILCSVSFFRRGFKSTAPERRCSWSCSSLKEKTHLPKPNPEIALSFRNCSMRIQSVCSCSKQSSQLVPSKSTCPPVNSKFKRIRPSPHILLSESEQIKMEEQKKCDRSVTSGHFHLWFGKSYTLSSRTSYCLLHIQCSRKEPLY